MAFFASCQYRVRDVICLPAVPMAASYAPQGQYLVGPALYPLWRVLEGSPLLYYVCAFNPFTHAVEWMRFALYGKDAGTPIKAGRRVQRPSDN